MHFSVADLLCNMLGHLTSIALNLKGQGQLVNFAKGRYFGVLSL